MWTAVIIASLSAVVLCIIASFLVSAWLMHRRYKRTVVNRTTLPAHPLDRHVTAILHIHNGAIVSVEEPKPVPAFSLPSSWYTRRRMFVSVGLFAMLAIALVVQGGLAGSGAMRQITSELGLTFLSPAQVSDVQPITSALAGTASQRLVRVDSAARDQYQTAYEWDTWSYSSCSGIAMEMVMDANGRHYIASEILQEELNLGVWSVSDGLLREDGIALTATHFGFHTVAGHTRSLQDVINAANSGTPVIVSVRDSTYFPNGHLFVIRGGDAQYVSIADSSPENFQRMTRSMFMDMWQTFSAVLTPNT